MIGYPSPRGTRDSAGIRMLLTPVSRPNPVVIGWRWRYELVSGAGLTAALLTLRHAAGMAGLIGAVATLVTAASLIAVWPPARRMVVSRAWCVITPHRIRTGCAQAWVHSRDGKIPVVLLTRARASGQRVWVWCRAGTSPQDLESARAQLAAACWAREIRVAPSPRYAHLAVIDVIRGPAQRAPLVTPRTISGSGQRWPGAEGHQPQSWRSQRSDAA